MPRDARRLCYGFKSFEVRFLGPLYQRDAHTANIVTFALSLLFG
jgi:hypothetical protein